MANLLPLSYWSCDDGLATNLKSIKDAFGRFDLNFVGTYKLLENGPLGKYMNWNASTALVTASSNVKQINSSFTIEFIFRPGFYFNGGQIFGTNNGSFNLRWVLNNGAPGVTSIPSLNFDTKHSSGQNTLSIRFNRVGRQSLGWFTDGKFHHVVCRFDSVTGKKDIWIDGQCPDGFSTTVPTGNLTTTGTDNTITFNSSTSYRKFNTDIDNIAIYNGAISDKQIYQHYLDFINGKKLSFTEYIGVIPTPDSVSGSYDALDFAPGTNLNSVAFVTEGVNISQINQLKSYPLPRYKKNNNLVRLFNWMGLQYLVTDYNASTPPSDTTANTAELKTILEEMIFNWNYMVPVAKYFQDGDTKLSNPNTFSGMMVKLANDNPSIPSQLITIRAQLPTGKLISNDLPDKNYLQNSAGQFLNITGNIVPKGQAAWRPLSTNLSDYKADGETVKLCVERIIKYLPNRQVPKINFINENGEIINDYSDTALNADPLVVQDRKGLSSQTHFAKRYREVAKENYADIFMSLPSLAGAYFSEYAIDGLTDKNDINLYRKLYSEARNINSTMNGQKYPTPDIYPRWPYNWRNWSTAWHGMQWAIQCRKDELASGDNLMSPFVSAGWDADERKIIRPSQWLGMLKLLGVMGSEFFYVGFFNDDRTATEYHIPYPPNYIWQAAMASYAQAIVSQYEDILRNGELMDGDYPRAYDPPQTNGPGYNFYCGDPRKMIMVRKHKNANKYIIAGYISSVTTLGENVEDISPATIILSGKSLTFNVRKQGSVYYYEDGIEPIFYQLDEWHENSHPSYWSKDFTLKAEMFESNSVNTKIKTESIQPQNFTQYRTYVTWNSIEKLDYYFNPRNSSNQYVWLNLRSVDGKPTGASVYLDDVLVGEIKCIQSTNWGWYKTNTSTKTPIILSGLTNKNYKISIVPLNTHLQMDEIHITENPGMIFNETIVNCTPKINEIVDTVVDSYLTSTGMPTNLQWVFNVETDAISSLYVAVRIKSNILNKPTGLKVKVNGVSVGGFENKLNTTWQWFTILSTTGKPKPIKFNKGINEIVFTPNNSRCDFIQFIVSTTPMFI